jgi:hypothetical protein
MRLKLRLRSGIREGRQRDEFRNVRGSSHDVEMQRGEAYRPQHAPTHPDKGRGGEFNIAKATHDAGESAERQKITPTTGEARARKMKNMEE